MGLLEKLKSVFGGSDGGSASSTGDADVAVEYDPAAESEHAVKGTDEAADPSDSAETAESTVAEETAESTVAEETAESVSTEQDTEAESGSGAEMETGAETESETESPSVDDIKGIGPTYSERLGDAGIETVADLAAADAETVAETAETSVSRADGWIDRAQDR